MKTFITLFLVLALLSGCATSSGQNDGLTDAKVKKIATVVELAAYNGSYLFLENNPQEKEIFKTVVKSLDILLDGDITLDKFLLIARELPIKELKSKEGQMVINSSIILFGVFQDDLVKLDQLEQAQKLKPIVLALKHGLERALVE
jgi:hypothetical protein